MHIIVKGGKRSHIGKRRSEQEENLRKEWGGTMDDGQLDKLKFIERELEKKTGSKENFIKSHDIDKIG